MHANPLAILMMSLVTLIMFILGISEVSQESSFHFSVFNKMVKSTVVLLAAAGMLVICSVLGVLVAAMP